MLVHGFYFKRSSKNWHIIFIINVNLLCWRIIILQRVAQYRNEVIINNFDNNDNEHEQLELHPSAD